MRKNGERFRTLAVVSVALVSMVVAGAVPAQDQEVHVAGMLVGFDEDDDGNFQRVYLEDDDLGPILVVDDETGKKLLELAGSQIEATGMLEDIEDGRFGLQIRVSSYRSIG